MSMTNELLVRAQEIILMDERDLLANGGEQIFFGPIVDDTVGMYAPPRSERPCARDAI